ncbi:O-antigen ligase family protein [Thiomonas sp.]|uniref:O-antigen ligase family protein n=1 Tax=Thiomonas sp. TaxID=2047785 RepID=UPI0026229D7E|nr:O-antigen ligase family protein [Thiomonas sp.]
MLVPVRRLLPPVPAWFAFAAQPLLLIYPALTLTVAGGVNTVFFLLFLLSAARWLADLRGLLRQSPAASSAVGSDPLSAADAMLYAASMAALPLAVFIGQWANQRWGWPYYDAVSRFLLAAPIFFALRRLPPQRLLVLWPGLIIGAFAAAAIVIFDPHDWGTSDGIARIGSTFVNPIHFGDIALTLGVLPAFGLGLHAGRPASVRALAWPAAALLAAAAGLYASVASGSRGGWIAIPVLIALAAMLHRGRLPARTLITAALALLLAAALAAASVPEIRGRIGLIFSNLHAFDHGNEDTSIGIRFQLWKAAWLIFTEHPLFGVGLGGFKALMTPMQQAGLLTPLAADFGRQEVHSEILSRLSQLGVVGLAAITAVYAVPGWLFWRRREAASPACRAAARMGLALVVGFVVYGLTVETFDLTMTAAFYALTVAVLLAAAYPKHPPIEHGSCSAS